MSSEKQSQPDELSLEVAGRLISGWQRVRVTRGIERLPADFDITLMDYYPGSDEKQLIKEGDPCVVRLGNDVVITGYIDRWMPAIKKGSDEIRVVGRGKCEDLVDCSAEWSGNVMAGLDALAMSQRLAELYSIQVSSDVTGLQASPQFIINWGESPQEIIDRACRWSALLYFDLPDGNLFLTRVGTAVAVSGVTQGENIQEAEYQSSRDQRFSEYSGLSMSISPVAEVSSSVSYGGTFLASAQDPEKMRYRKKVIIIESTMIANGVAQQYINWEMNRRYGRSKQLRVLVDSWRDASGKLWDINTLIPVSIPRFNLTDMNWLLSQVTFTRDDRGTTAELILMPPEAFTVEPYQFYQEIRELNQ
ncbi:MAG: phage tail protein [Citrobacter sp.]